MSRRPVQQATPQAQGPRDGALIAGAAIVAVGIIAAIITLVPLFTDAAALPLPFYLVSLLAPLGMGVILLSLWRKARARSGHRWQP